MAKALYRSSDVASFDTYPSGPQFSEDPNRLLAAETESSSLEQYGAQLGSAAGMAVVALRRAQDAVRVMTIQTHVTDIASTRLEEAAARLQQVREQAMSHAEQWGRNARVQAMEWRRQAKKELYRARLRAREIQNVYPVHVVIAAGVAGLALGTGLRIWRSLRA
jgi:hypothetical protein